MRPMYLFVSPKTACFFLFSAILLQTAVQNAALGQSSGGGNADPTISDPGISGMSIQSTELESKFNQMPKFSGFGSLDSTSYIGRSTYNPVPRTASGTALGQRSTGRSSTQSSGNTRTTTTGSRTSRSNSSMRNRNTSGMMGGMGRMGGMGSNTNTVRSVTTLGYFLSESAETVRQTETARISQLEYRINNSRRITPLSPITVELADSTVILRGTVENERQRKFLEQLVKLEPGISNVQNELTFPIEMK